MKQHTSLLLVGVLGMVLSASIVLALAYGELRSRENLTVKLRQAQESEAAQLSIKNSPHPISK